MSFAEDHHDSGFLPCDLEDLLLRSYYTLFELMQVSVDGLQTLKPQPTKSIRQAGVSKKRIKETVEQSGGINAEVRMVISDDNVDRKIAKWVVENLKFSVKHPVIRVRLFKY